MGGILVNCFTSPGRVTGGGQSSEMKRRGTSCLPSTYREVKHQKRLEWVTLGRERK